METSRKPAAQQNMSNPSTWLDLHGDALYRYALQRVRNRETAEELVQETLLAALRGYSEFEGRSSERTWLVAVMRRKIVDYFRNRATADQNQTGEYVRFRADTFDRKGKWRIKPTDWPRDEESVIERDEFWKAFDDCFGALSPALADAFCLCEMEQLETETACKVLRISASNLWTRLHRARQLLRRCLESNWFSQAGRRF